MRRSPARLCTCLGMPLKVHAHATPLPPKKPCKHSQTHNHVQTHDTIAHLHKQHA